MSSEKENLKPSDELSERGLEKVEGGFSEVENRFQQLSKQQQMIDTVMKDIISNIS